MPWPSSSRIFRCHSGLASWRWRAWPITASSLSSGCSESQARIAACLDFLTGYIRQKPSNRSGFQSGAAFAARPRFGFPEPAAPWGALGGDCLVVLHCLVRFFCGDFSGSGNSVSGKLGHGDAVFSSVSEKLGHGSSPPKSPGVSVMMYCVLPKRPPSPQVYNRRRYPAVSSSLIYLPIVSFDTLSIVAIPRTE